MVLLGVTMVTTGFTMVRINFGDYIELQRGVNKITNYRGYLVTTWGYHGYY